MKFKLLAAVMVLLTAFSFAGCGNKDKGSVKPPETGYVKVSPEKDEANADLGEYWLGSDGIKLYFNEETHPLGIAEVVRDYFTAVQKGDFEKFRGCIDPNYREILDAFLVTKDSTPEKSFETQRSSLAGRAGGADYAVTRIKIETPIYDKMKNRTEGDYLNYLEELGGIMGGDIKSAIINNNDAIYEITFFLMVKTEGVEQESVIIEEQSMIVTEKNGNFHLIG